MQGVFLGNLEAEKKRQRGGFKERRTGWRKFQVRIRGTLFGLEALRLSVIVDCCDIGNYVG